ncbi:protein phosphatase 2C domain-containing protein [Kineosporia babensis]|uniref:Protein phosphatase 2C domain-containing protein n=1 Tax=Kineosporia babensis TaxID=499548 RepID=A0A9X1STL6_9ACTN|nr:protein phosphatase 2C domain-containing protein [Kineosporia babensis]MCD5312039.1 protein phosphatase 2C domain-containing protein [Kineosporia babensis]
MTFPIAELISLPRRHGSSPDGEDAGGFDEVRGRFVLSDGAGSAFSARTWARTLVRHFINDPEAGWHEQAVASWRAGLTLRTPRTRRAAEQGSAATLVGLAMADGVGWQATAVGDSCLYVLRAENNLLPEAFPIAWGDRFPAAPELWTTGRPPRLARLAGTAAPGDVLILATDAVARWASAGPPSIWRWLATTETEQLSATLAKYRDESEIEDDDLSVLIVRPPL